mgnify:CR=1 FL=1
MAIKGSLKEASLPDVLQLLALGKKSGCLAVADRQNFGYVYFDEGRICYASIVNRRDRIGDLLVKNGRVSPEQLEEAIALQEQRRDSKLGELLVEISAVTRKDLEDYMRIQIEEAVYYLFTWTQGTFNFEAGMRPDQDFLVRINPESLLLEGARRVDEWSLIERRSPASTSSSPSIGSTSPTLTWSSNRHRNASSVSSTGGATCRISSRSRAWSSSRWARHCTAW